MFRYGYRGLGPGSVNSSLDSLDWIEHRHGEVLDSGLGLEGQVIVNFTACNLDLCSAVFFYFRGPSAAYNTQLFVSCSETNRKLRQAKSAFPETEIIHGLVTSFDAKPPKGMVLF